MLRQVAFEFKKHFLKPAVGLALLLFLLMDALKIGALYQEKSVFSRLPDSRNAYDTLYEAYGGSLTTDKITSLLSLYWPIQSEVDSGAASTDYEEGSILYNKYSDELLLRWCFVEPMEYTWKYRQNASELVEAAKENAAFYQDKGNTYAYRQNVIIAGLFSGRMIPEFLNVEMYQYYLQYDFSIFFVLLLCVYALVNVFVLEKETEMELLILTTANGNKNSTAAKIIASLLFAAGVSFVFWLADLLFFSLIWGGFYAGTAPVYAVEFFEYAPLGVSLLQYAGLSMLLKTAGILIFTLVVLLLSCLCGNALLPFVGGGFAVLVCLGAYAIKPPLWLDGLALCNPVCLLVNRELFHSVDFVCLMGWPVSTWLIPLGSGLLAAVILLAVLWKKARKNCLGVRRGTF